MKPFSGAAEAIAWLRAVSAAGRCSLFLGQGLWEARYSRRYKEWTLWASEKVWSDILPIEAIHERPGGHETWYHNPYYVRK